MERAAYQGLRPPLNMVEWDGGFALPRLIIIISQLRQRSKRWQLITAVRLDHHLTWDLDQSLNLTPNPLVLLQIIFPSNSILLWDKGL